MDYLDKFVPDVTFEKIPIRNLVSNQEYQRNLSMVHVEKAVDNFDIFQINPVKVNLTSFTIKQGTCTYLNNYSFGIL